jgi:XTP/dITP diphosphohydrolase
MNKKTLLIGTGNKGKFLEMKLILSDLFLQIISPEDCNCAHLVIEERGRSFEENALIKLEAFRKNASTDFILCEDSGLEVQALRGELGVYTRRFGAGVNASDEEWLSFFLEKMKNIENRRARFVCCAALLFNNEIKIFEGIVEGAITEKKEADIIPGLPLSSCFKPEGSDKVYAALSSEEKAKISHRAWALAGVKKFLETVI